jgi:superfamily II DNA or RNA helicase
MAEQPLAASAPEDIFVELFCQTFGLESAQYLTPQYPFTDVYGGGRFIDYALQTEQENIAFEIDSEVYHAPFTVTPEKWEDDLLRQNSLIHQCWRVFRWTDRQLAERPERVQEELAIFLHALRFTARDDYLPHQHATAFSLRTHQRDALEELTRLRAGGVTIALLTHATGLGKTLVAVQDARRMRLRTLFVAHRKVLIKQAMNAFRQHWPECSLAMFDSQQGRPEADIVVGTVQGISGNLHLFRDDDFGYLVVDEAHHASAETYRRLISFFRPRFILGLTGTPQRGDGENIVSVFQNVAHRMDLRTAIQQGLLVSIRCIRVTTNINMADVRFNGVRYNLNDLETRLVVEERNALIVQTYREHAEGKQAVAFCVNIRHAELLAAVFTANGVPACAVSGRLAQHERDQRLSEYHTGQVRVLCACDVLNEGWDSPDTEVLLMARPTLSRQLYLQQLGRGTRTAPGKAYLLVFDFVDSSNRFNRGITLHQVAGRSQYRPGGLVLAPDEQIAEEEQRITSGEKPEAFLNLHLWVRDLEYVDILDWRDESTRMLSASQLSIELGVDSTTVGHWIRNAKLEPDLTVPIG